MPLVNLTPTADAAAQAWAPVGAATNWQAVSDGVLTTYNLSGNPADRDSFTLGNLPGGALTVFDVTLRFWARTTGVYPGVAQFHAFWSVGADELVSPTIQVDYFWHLYTLAGVACPDGLAWSVAKANSLVLGYEIRVAPPGKGIQIAECYVPVTYDETEQLVEIPSANVGLTRTASGAVGLVRTATADVFLGRA